MQPENLKFGGGLNSTVLHPFVLVAMIVSIVLILALPRKYAFLPLLVMTLLSYGAQQIYVGGIHLFVSRIIILVAGVRLLVSRSSYSQVFAGGFDKVDKLFLLSAGFHSAAMILLLGSGTIVNQIGFLWDVLGGFFLLRFFIRDQNDIRRLIRGLGFVATVVAANMLIEHFRRVNMFGYLGGFRLIPEVREGSLRAQGPFEHPLLAGAFGATLLPLFVWLWTTKKNRVMAVSGIISSTVISLMSASSTPIMAYAAGVFGLCMWPLRSQLRIIRWLIVGTLAALQVAMKAPVWFLIARVDLVGGSSGYHRALLVDQFIRNFFDWWLIGTNNNGNWGFDMWDTCNQFVQEGLNGGLVAFICFITILVFSFQRLGIARKKSHADKKQAWFFWVLGVAVFAHLVAFFGISYFDQTKMSWFALLAMISAALATCQTIRKERTPPPAILPSVVLQPVSHSYSPFDDNVFAARITVADRDCKNI